MNKHIGHYKRIQEHFTLRESETEEVDEESPEEESEDITPFLG